MLGIKAFFHDAYLEFQPVVSLAAVACMLLAVIDSPVANPWLSFRRGFVKGVFMVFFALSCSGLYAFIPIAEGLWSLGAMAGEGQVPAPAVLLFLVAGLLLACGKGIMAAWNKNENGPPAPRHAAHAKGNIDKRPGITG